MNVFYNVRFRRKPGFNWTLSTCMLLCILTEAKGMDFRSQIKLNEKVVQQQKILEGKVVDEKGLALTGVSVKIKGTNIGTSTDKDGKYSFKVASLQGIIVFSYTGFIEQEISIDGKANIDVVLAEDNTTLEDVAIVAFGTQKKSSIVSSITTINPKELQGPTGNLTTMLAGRIAGMIAYQRSGEPGQDNASFFIRGVTSFGAGKVDPLILIDGVESSPTDLARLQPEDIEYFSVLKDATASSLYGARGANGVILLKTKTGMESKTNLSVRFENSMSSNTQNFQLSDNITYMKLANEASLTRNANRAVPYTKDKILNTQLGLNPVLYPNNNWVDQLVKDFTMNQRTNINLKGGNKTSNYYISGTYNIDNGVLKVAELNNFNSNIKLKNYALRSNVSIDLTKTTKVVIRTSGQFDDYTGPVGGGKSIFASAMSANPVMFPAIYPQQNASTKHPLFGNAVLPGSLTALYNNPFANAVSGYQDYNSSTLIAQLEFQQDLGFVAKGLTARAMGYTTRYSYFDVVRSYSPFFYSAFSLDDANYSLNALNPTAGTDYLDYREGQKRVTTTSYLEAALNYNTYLG